MTEPGMKKVAIGWRVGWNTVSLPFRGEEASRIGYIFYDLLSTPASGSLSSELDIIPWGGRNITGIRNRFFQGSSNALLPNFIALFSC